MTRRSCLIHKHLDFSWPNYPLCLSTDLHGKIMASRLAELVICGEIGTEFCDIVLTNRFYEEPFFKTFPGWVQKEFHNQCNHV